MKETATMEARLGPSVFPLPLLRSAPGVFVEDGALPPPLLGRLKGAVPLVEAPPMAAELGSPVGLLFVYPVSYMERSYLHYLIVMSFQEMFLVLFQVLSPDFTKQRGASRKSVCSSGREAQKLLEALGAPLQRIGPSKIGHSSILRMPKLEVLEPERFLIL